MRVGITCDLRQDYLAMGYGEEETAEFDRPDTLLAIEQALGELGYQTDRIGHAQALVKRLAAGDRWDLVFNFAEGLYGYGREALVPALLDAYRIPYTFSDPLVLALCLEKGTTKRVLRDLGLPTADFAVVATEADLERVELPYPLFAKPIAEGTGKGVTTASRVSSREALGPVCRKLLADFHQPVLVETFLPGREFTVGIVGTGARASAVAVLEIVLLADAEKEVYSYVNKEYCERLVEYRPVKDAMAAEASELAVRAWRGLDCRDAGRIDLRADRDGSVKIIEVNPLAGLHPHHSDLPMCCTAAGMSYLELIDRIMREALTRTALEPPAPATRP